MRLDARVSNGSLLYEVSAPDQIRVVELNARALLGIKPAPKRHKPRRHHK